MTNQQKLREQGTGEQQPQTMEERLEELKCINGALYFGSLDEYMEKCDCGESKCNNQTYYKEGVEEIKDFINQEIALAVQEERERAYSEGYRDGFKQGKFDLQMEKDYPEQVDVIVKTNTKAINQQ